METTSDNVTWVEERITDTRYNCTVWLKGGFKSKWKPICRVAGHLQNLACVQTSPLPQKKAGEETSVNRRR